MSSRSIYPRQLLLDLDTQQDQTFGNFIVGRNQHLYTLMQACNPLYHGYANSIYCWSPLRSGKTHLLRAYCFNWQQQGLHVNYINCESGQGLDAKLLSSNMAVATTIDHIQATIEDPNHEEDVLFFLKTCQEVDHTLIISGDRAPAQLRSEELATRLMAFYVFQLYPPSGDALREFVRAEAKKLGLGLDKEMEDLLFHNCAQRDLEFATKLLKRLALDYQPLSTHRIANEVASLRH